MFEVRENGPAIGNYRDAIIGNGTLVATTENRRPFATGNQPLRNLRDERRFPRASDAEIADTDNWAFETPTCFGVTLIPASPGTRDTCIDVIKQLV